MFRGRRQGFGLPEWIAFALYSAMVLITAARHEPWADEAQAWLIARDRGFWDMMWWGVRYEGTPGLWHTLLWVPAHAGMPYASMQWIAAAIAISGAFALLRFSPFPWPVRVLLPFTFFLGYQYAVVARSYVLFPLLCFVAAVCFRQRASVGLAVALALLANVSSHGFVVAAGLAIAYGAQALSLVRVKKSPIRISAPVIYSAGALIAMATAWQPPDVSFVQPQFTRMLRTPSATAPAAAAAPVPQPAHRSIKEKASRALRLFSLGISTSLIFSAFVSIACVAWLFARRAAILLLPLLFLLFILCVVYMSPWHAGMIFVTLITILWIAWPEHPGTPDYALAALLSLVCLLQIPWTLRAVHYDMTRPYDGSEACARYLASTQAGKIFGYTPYSTGVLPWFGANIFANQPRFSYWYWSTANRATKDPGEIAREHPDAVVISYEDLLPAPWAGNPGIDPEVAALRDTARADGYHIVRDFTGSMPMQNGFNSVNHCEVYRRD